MLTACTIIARNYFAHARVLAKSFLAHHRGGAFSILLIDDEEGEGDPVAPSSVNAGSGGLDGVEFLRLRDIGFSREDILLLAAYYDVTELATAVKPVLLRYLIDRGAASVIYLDPDIKVYRPLDAIERLSREHGIVLTPHILAPIPRDRRRIDEFHILAAGAYNLGFAAVGARATDFLSWWWERTRRDGRIDPMRMMFTDQRWIDFVPSLFDHIIWKDPGCNVAYWNLHERDLTFDAGRYLVNGVPLTFFHFSGFDVRTPYLLSKHQGDQPRILLSERPAVAQICDEYRADVQREGVAAWSALPYGWNRLPSGVPFDRQMRRVYRDAIIAADRDGRPEPPNPFAAEREDEFIGWLNEPSRLSARALPRYLTAIYQDRADLQLAFPDPEGVNREQYLTWLRTDGVAQLGIPRALLPSTRSDEPRYAAPDVLQEGVNIAGYFRAELGVGEAGRLLTKAIDAAGIDHATATWDLTPSRQEHPFVARGEGKAPYDVNVLCINADQTRSFAEAMGPGLFDGRHTVGYWFWELERFPSSMHRAFDYVDEVWAATRFVADGIRAIGRKPVHTIPLPVVAPQISPEVTRRSLDLPDSFLFLFAFDFFSVLERKNPLGLIEAFRRAFAPGEGPVLVLKSINGEKRLTELERVRDACKDRPDILVIDRYYSAAEKNSLMGLCDCYISLHRSEGLGLTMAEAMALEKPVIATGYSGNVDFMTEENSYLVDFGLGAVPRGCDPYPAGSQWAEPNLDHAVELMRRVYRDPGEARAKAATARRDIQEKHGVEQAARIVKARIDDIHRARRGRALEGKRTPMATNPDGNPWAGSNAHLNRAETLLTPTPSVPPGRAFGGPLKFLQSTLFRLLRPYWWQQREANRLMLGSLREVVAAAASSTREAEAQRDALAALWAAVHSLQAGAEGRGASERELVEGQRRLADAQQSTSATVGELERRLGELVSRSAELTERLYPKPYMQDPAAFDVVDATGARRLGFSRSRPDAGDAYLRFEDIFRGSETLIRERFRRYLPILRRHARVVDIGSGRGELLDVLRDAGIAASGVDVDEGMIRASRAKGHTVEHTDAISFLRAQPADSLPAIFAAQVVEHLTYEDFFEFLRLSQEKLSPGGQLVFETVNPHALEALKTFWVDLTHQRPIFPEVAVAWCWILGFDEGYVLYPNASGDDDEASRRTAGEYAVVATKAAK